MFPEMNMNLLLFCTNHALTGYLLLVSINASASFYVLNPLSHILYNTPESVWYFAKCSFFVKYARSQKIRKYPTKIK